MSAVEHRSQKSTSVSMSVLDRIACPDRVWSRSEVLNRPCPVTKESGIYAWYFRQIPPGVPSDGCVIHNGLRLLYIGISPTKRREGLPPSRQCLRDRVRYHYRGNADGSTLRLTLGCLLAEQLGIELRRVGSGKRMTFGPGEAKLSEWMSENAFVTWSCCPEPWVTEERLISTLCFPLNLDQNGRNTFHPTLSEVRLTARHRAKALDVLR